MAQRPDLTRAIRALLEDVVARMPEFAHVDPSRIIVVAGEARRASRGTVKPLTFRGGKHRDAEGNRKPLVKLHGRKMLYCVTLRPLFFRDSTVRERVETLLHELFHISPRFDGTLDERHRHERMGPRFARRLKPMVRRYLKECPSPLLVAFGHHGEVRVQQWLERPGSYLLPGGKGRRVYTEAHLFVAHIRMRTRPLGPGSKKLKTLKTEGKVSPLQRKLH